MRDAESTLDQLISFCGDKIEEPDVLSMFGLAAQGQIKRRRRFLFRLKRALRRLQRLLSPRNRPRFPVPRRLRLWRPRIWRRCGRN
jgi:hypothetical protein